MTVIQSAKKQNRYPIAAARRAFTLIETMIVVLIIGVLLAIAVPNFTKARETSYKKACIENLGKVQYAKESYMMEQNLPITTPSAAFTDAVLYGPSGFLKSKPLCPGGGGGTDYVPNDGADFPTCDYGGGTVHVIGM
jgi:prepilin-type N-terminal cleavage/methylation domain-containing protein